MTDAHSSPNGAKWLVGFLLYEFACQLLLLVPALGAIRVLLRIAAFGGSLALLLMLPGKALSKHPARTPLTIAVVLLAISAVNPTGGGLLASAAHAALYLAILSPVFWVARLHVTLGAFERLMIAFWLYYTASAAVGLLQVYFPGRFQPPLASILAERGPAYLDSMMIELASGESVLRPMGLTDAPGGAAGAGFYAALLGLGLVQARTKLPGARWLAAASMLIGVMILYLAQVRSLLVVLGLSTIVLTVLHALAARLSRFVVIAAVSAAIAMVAYSFAVELGGSSVTSRLATLTADAPGKVYYTNRGIFLEYTFVELLPRFPLGGGLGRWGMMNTYFGSAASALWVEIQWTGWLIDGGVPLILAYAAAVLVTIRQVAKTALSREGHALASWAPLVAAYGVGVLALTFNATPFMGTSGLEFWLINAAFFQALTTASAGAESSA